LEQDHAHDLAARRKFYLRCNIGTILAYQVRETAMLYAFSSGLRGSRGSE
jgi:hypothetical protein